MQIKDLPVSTTLASTDVLVKETSTGATQGITGANAAASLKTLGDLLGTSDVVNNLTSGGTTSPLSAEMGKTLAGKVVDSMGSNENGSYIKFANGFMIAYTIITNFTFTKQTTTTATKSFPAAFAYAPVIVLNVNTTIPDKLILSTYGVNLMQYVLNGVSTFSADQSPTIFMIAVGSWK